MMDQGENSDETPEHDGTGVPGDAPRTTEDLPDSTEDELAAELRRLFEDDRLSLAVRGDAADTVVAGAGRRRRRQVVLASAAAVLAVLAMVSAGVATVAMTRTHGVQTAQPDLSTSPSTGAAPSGTGSTSAPSPAPTTSQPSGRASTTPRSRPTEPQAPPPQLVGILLGHDGYGQLKLGMSEQDAANAGLIVAPQTTPPPTSDGATSTTAAPPAPATCDTQQSTQYPWITALFVGGYLQQVSATEAHTPEGVGTGSTTAQIVAAYSAAYVHPDSIVVIGDSSQYVFALRNGVVGSVTIQGDTQAIQSCRAN